MLRPRARLRRRRRRVAAPATTEPAKRASSRSAWSPTSGQLNDRGFNQLAYEGLKRAEKELGVKIRVAESRVGVRLRPELTSLAREGYDLVIGVGFAQGDAIVNSAPRASRTRSFAIIDVDQSTLKGKPANVVGMLFREEQAGYLAGYLAGRSRRSEAPGPDVISSVGGFKEPPVDRFIAGYQAGAKAAAPGDQDAQRLLVRTGTTRRSARSSR